jgi:hypothetical protein
MFKIILGLAMVVAGALMVIKSEAVLNTFGRMAFFEKNLGTEGGSRLGYKLIGIVVVFFGALVMTNLFGSFAQWVFSPLIDLSNPKK